jgi:hypothetical protein
VQGVLLLCLPACSSGLSLLQAVKPMIKTKLQHNEINLYMYYPPQNFNAGLFMVS